MFTLNKCCAELLVLYMYILVAVAIIVGAMSPAKDLLNLSSVTNSQLLVNETT
jgi:hypothetical protein